MLNLIWLENDFNDHVFLKIKKAKHKGKCLAEI